MHAWSSLADRTVYRLRRAVQLIFLVVATLLTEWPAMAEEQQMRFVVVRSNQAGCEPTCTEWISAEGAIGPKTPSLLKATLKAIGDRKLPLVLASSGGDMAAAMAIGRLVRKNKLSVAVGTTNFVGCQRDQENCTANDKRGAHYIGDAASYGECVRACTLVLASGVRRLAGEGTFVADAPMTAASLAETKRLVAYYGEMGVRYNALVEGDPGHWQLFKALLLTSTLPVGQVVDAEICRGTPAPNNCRVFTTMDLE
ncbi:hypothetical protein [Ensifer sp. MJa1]|uniref:hypothetical protein n=1 Tax=Ensifer sp. MJa1 TaxID=2919888 RepID=UPI00300A4765